MKLVEDPSILSQLEGGGSQRPVRDPATLANLEFGIDVARPADVVRADIGKLQGTDRDRALNLWSDAYVANERKDGGVGMATDNIARTLARGTFAGPWLDELTAATQKGLQVISGGALGSDYDEALAYQRARDRAVDRDYPLMSTAGQLASGLGTGIAGIRAAPGVISAVTAGPVAALTPAQTVAGRIGQASGIGAAYGASSGFGNSEGGAGDAASQLARRGEGAIKGGILGGILGGGIGVAGEGVRQVARARANMGEAGAYGRIADDLAGGVDQLADEVAVGATRGQVTGNRRVLDVLGEEMERVGGNVALAQRNTIDRIVRETGVTPQTAAGQIRRLSQVHRDSDLLLGEYPAVSQSDTAQRLRAPGNIDLDELGRTQASTTQAKLDYLANNGNAQSAQNVRNAIGLRQEDLSPSMRATLQSVGPQIPTGPRSQRPATIVDSADMEDAARTAGALAYQVAHNSGLAVQPAALQTAVEQFIAHHAGRANARAGAVGDAIISKGLREFYERDPMTNTVLRDQNGRPVIIDVTRPEGLQRLQDARASLGAELRKANREGDGNTAAALQPMYHDTRPNVRTGQLQPDITRIMEAASPQWGTANRAWADMNFGVIGQDLGDAFSTKAGPQFRDQLEQFRGLAPEAQNIVRIHFLQKLYDKLDNLPDTHSISKLFSNDHARNAMRTLFGDEAAVALTRATRDQRVAESSQRMMANSATHRRGQAQKQEDAETGLVAAAENASVRGVRNWLIERAAQILTENRNRPMAGILTTPMSDTARVAHHIHRLRNQEGVLATYNQPTTTSSAVSGPLGEQTGRGLAEDAETRRKRNSPANEAVSESRMLSHARNALLRGADRASVIERLKSYGIDPSKLDARP